MNNLNFKSIAQGFLGLLLLIFFIWLAFYALILVLIVAAVATLYVVVRRFLMKQGILKPQEPAYRDDHDAPIIEVDYNEVETDEEQKNDPR